MTDVGYVTSKGQTTVPKAVRKRLGMEPGSKLEWIVEGERAFVTVSTGRAVDLAGMLGNPLGRTVSVEEMNESIAQAAVERFERSRDRR